jgi:REP element-mobilizing transposase RayT
MDRLEDLNHSKWECTCHVVVIPKRRRKTLFGTLRKYLGDVFHRLASRRESRIEEGHVMPDHVHMLVSVPRSMRCRKWWVTAREQRDAFGARVRRTQAELRRSALLGARVFRLHGGARRTGDPGVHPAARSGGSPVGSAASVEAVRATIRWPVVRGDAMASPSSRFERPPESSRLRRRIFTDYLPRNLRVLCSPSSPTPIITSCTNRTTPSTMANRNAKENAAFSRFQKLILCVT